MRFASASLALLMLLGLWAPGARAEDEGPSLKKAVQGGLSSLAVEVPLVHDPDAQPVFVDHLALDPEGRELDFFRLAKQLAKYTLKNAEGGEGATHKGIATKYSVPGGGVQRGDGRTATVGWEPTLGADVQIQGVATGLAPQGFRGREGQKLLQEAGENILFGLYRNQNGGNAQRTLALFDHGPWGNDALEVRAGHFERFAHLYELRNDSAAQRALLAHLNDNLKFLHGLEGRLSYDKLYEGLVSLRAYELAGEFFNRLAHSALTYDNNAFLNTVDFDQSTAVDRTHQRYSHSSDSPIGFGQEAYFVLKRLYVAELTQLMQDAARDEGERAAIAAYREPAAADAAADNPAAGQQQAEDHPLKGEVLAEQLLFGFMGERMLEHLGFDADVQQRVIAERPREIATLLNELLSLGLVESNREHLMAKEVRVERPANYDIYRGLAHLVRVHTSKGSAEAKREDLLAALDPIDRSADALERAGKLLESAAPVIEAALEGKQGKEREALADLFADEARRINRPVPMMVREHVARFVRNVIDQHKVDYDAPDFNARLHAYARENVRKGETSPVAVAHALRHDGLPVTEDGRQVLLSSLRENSVLIQELAGAEDTIQIVLQRPSHIEDSSWLDGLKLEFVASRNDTADPHHDGFAPTDSWDPKGAAQRIDPLEKGKDLLVFSLPHAAGSKSRYRFRFVGRDGQQELLVRSAFEPHLGQSHLVEAEVAHWAARNGLSREVRRPQDVEAVRSLQVAPRRAAPAVSKTQHQRTSGQVVNPSEHAGRGKGVAW